VVFSAANGLQDGGLALLVNPIVDAYVEVLVQEAQVHTRLHNFFHCFVIH